MRAAYEQYNGLLVSHHHHFTRPTLRLTLTSNKNIKINSSTATCVVCCGCGLQLVSCVAAAVLQLVSFVASVVRQLVLRLRLTAFFEVGLALSVPAGRWVLTLHRVTSSA